MILRRRAPTWLGGKLSAHRSRPTRRRHGLVPFCANAAAPAGFARKNDDAMTREDRKLLFEIHRESDSFDDGARSLLSIASGSLSAPRDHSMRRSQWVFAFLALLAACGPHTDDQPPPHPDSGPDQAGTVCDGGGLSQVGCACQTEGLYECVFSGTGIQCMRGKWVEFLDGPCGPPLDGRRSCTDQELGCRCTILGERICVGGQALICDWGGGRWGNDPFVPSACGDSGATDADARKDATTDQDIGKLCDGGGLSQVGCPCQTEGLYQCFGGSGLECLNGTWTRFLDGACWQLDGSNQCTDEIVGCRCPIFRQRICSNGQGLQCEPGIGRWMSDAAACGDSGGTDADSGGTDADASSARTAAILTSPASKHEVIP
jgi:hypothetical protein